MRRETLARFDARVEAAALLTRRLTADTAAARLEAARRAAVERADAGSLDHGRHYDLAETFLTDADRLLLWHRERLARLGLVTREEIAAALVEADGDENEVLGM